MQVDFKLMTHAFALIPLQIAHQMPLAVDFITCSILKNGICFSHIFSCAPKSGGVVVQDKNNSSQGNSPHQQCPSFLRRGAW
jgi:hypothetical protein